MSAKLGGNAMPSRPGWSAAIDEFDAPLVAPPAVVLAWVDGVAISLLRSKMSRTWVTCVCVRVRRKRQGEGKR